MTAFAAAAALGGLAVAVPLAGTASAATETQTFSYTGGPQSFIVPAGVTSLHVVVTGGDGASSANPGGPVIGGGSGAQVTADLPVGPGGAVQPGERLAVLVGGDGVEAAGSPGAAGYNGGGPGGSSYQDGPGAYYVDGGGGGGASEITGPDGTLAGALVVAGGGGGAGASAGYVSGGLGGSAGEHGQDSGSNAPGGGPGATVAGGAGGGNGAAGTSGQGGAGGTAGASSGGFYGGGGGGGGYYGGGGGSSSGAFSVSAGAGGGGGGASYTAPGTQNVSYWLGGGTPSVTITWTAISVDTTSLPAATVGQSYSQALAASGGSTPYTWEVASGQLPAGLKLDAGTGVIAGTPVTAKDSTFTVEVVDASDVTASEQLTIDVGAALAVTTASLPGGTVGTAYSQTLAASGGTAPYTWSVTAGALPAGLSLDAGTGVISGNPATAQAASFTVTATDAAGKTASKSLSVTVGAAPTACTATVSGTHSTQLNVTSGVLCLVNAKQNGQVTVSGGASLSVSNSTVSGTVTVTGAGSVSYCGSTENGTLTVTGTSGAVTLGGNLPDGTACAADTIPSIITVSGTGGAVTVNGLKENGTLTLSANAGPVTLNGSTLSGLAHVEDNTGSAVTVSGNKVTGSLYCTGNTATPDDNGSVNTVSGTASGQCAALATR